MNCSFELSANAKEYALRQLLQRAGADSGIPVLYQPLEGKTPRPCIYIVPCEARAWGDVLQKKIESIPTSQTIPSGEELSFWNGIPILFRGAGFESQTKFAEQREDGTVIFYADILAAAFFMLTRWEETVSEERDIHGRFTAAQSVAYKQGFLNIPVIDQYALILRAWMKHLAPSWRPPTPKPALYLTHDIDFIHQYSNLRELIYAFGIATFSHNPIEKLRRELKNLYNQIFHPARESRLLAVYELAALSHKNGLKSHFYFMAVEAHKQQQGYNPALPQLNFLYQSLLSQGHAIGIHPGYTTFKNLKTLKTEKENLENACGIAVTSGRQHFLRFHPPSTWRDWEQAGLQTDSTLGYADHEGFRCGTCHPYPPFDIEADREVNMLEIPLIVMDTTLKVYRKLSPSQGRDTILRLAGECASVGGTFVLLWHNTSLLEEWKEWGAMYRNVLDDLRRMLDLA